ncbi:GHMP family kinase ATP-binding protein [Micromonospora chersina]|uniref:GHMP family kinase ATP-binding protein n=1 Tax=Micromonospora chersina TaxID=47854 RepID=UPI0037131B9E
MTRQLLRPERPERSFRARGSAVSSAFGTFGELLQGALPEGPDFLVTLPIARWSTAAFEYDGSREDVETFPATKTKARRVAEAVLARHAAGGGGSLRLSGSLPEGRGLASSSADLVATARAVAGAIGLDMPPTLIEDLLRPIEPTDGVMYPGVVAFDHREVRHRRSLGILPPMTIVGIDEGGPVDTVAFNAIPKNFTDRDREEYAALLAELGTAVAAADNAAIGRIATRSAHLNQRLCPKRSLHAMTALSAELGGVGVVAAHSGSAIGLLLPQDVPDYRSRLAEAIRRCRQLVHSQQLLCCQTLDLDPAGIGVEL